MSAKKTTDEKKETKKKKLEKISLENLALEVGVLEEPTIEEVEKVVEPKHVVGKSLDSLKYIKQDYYKQERIEETAEEKLIILGKRFLRSQYLQDEILASVYNEIQDDLITTFKPQTIKVYRANQLYFCTCDTKFTFGEKVFYICSHNKKDSTIVLQFIEEETILEGYNVRLRDISSRIYKK